MTTPYQKLRELDWEVLMHSSYSPDLTPSDYYLFLSLQNSFNIVKLASNKACENYFSKFFIEKKRNSPMTGL